MERPDPLKEDFTVKRVALLGSTGSIGTQALDVVRAYPDRLKVTAFAALKSVDKLEAQIREFNPLIAVLYDEDAAKELKLKVKDLPVKVLSGMDGLIAAASMEESDILLTAVVGMIGIRPTIAGINAGKDIALANKETLVTAGHIIMPLAKEKGVRILPVDSEHSAIFQSLQGTPGGSLEKIWLTCSGGPFRGKKRDELKNVKPEDALKHPNWSMGKKITIDSATLVNKGLEVMEAAWLFDVPATDINVLVHPQSIIHSMVQFKDGAVIGELGLPDMKLPIQYALFYPSRLKMDTPRADFYDIAKLSFERADTETFTGLKLAFDAAGTGGSMPVVFNAANEKAVSLFLDRKISFLQIAEIINDCMDAHRVKPAPSLEEILEAEKETCEHIASMVFKEN
ncbi:MAG: 1-deoxy-D-xylulose-5-phosphate reductoisomerase [Lachnospiraceae bacterium]|nr:1-deoxy-D-xylulose-5-phosphate reductoisomerase [Lachnospiraceae bacterium]